MKIALLLLLVLLPAATMSFAFQLTNASKPLVIWSIALPYALLAGIAIARMWKDGELAQKLKPRSGDLAKGAFVAMLLYLGAVAGTYLLSPSGTAREQWLVRLYLQIGDPELFQRHVVPMSLLVAGVAALEEIAWRGLGFDLVERTWGTRRAFSIVTGLYGLAHVPSLIVLAVPGVGWNPLLFLAAVGCGIVWTFLVAKTGRLTIAVFSHALFTWLVTVQFPLWQLS